MEQTNNKGDAREEKAETTMPITANLMVSAPTHLRLALLALADVELPDNIRTPLSKFVEANKSQGIGDVPYDMIRSITRWARTSGGKSALKAHELGESPIQPFLLFGLFFWDHSSYRPCE
jgi:hypothetical protein